MQSACERWTALAPMNKTWVNFQDMFTSAHDTYEAITAQAGGYHGVNNVHAQETEKFYNFANLAMAKTADKDLLSTLTNTNYTLTNKLATKDKIIAALQEQLRSS
jgi:glycogen synthase